MDEYINIEDENNISDNEIEIIEDKNNEEYENNVIIEIHNSIINYSITKALPLCEYLTKDMVYTFLSKIF